MNKYILYPLIVKVLTFYIIIYHIEKMKLSHSMCPTELKFIGFFSNMQDELELYFCEPKKIGGVPFSAFI